MTNWRRAEDILGETIREIGTLVVVFAPLEAVFAERSISYVAVTVMVLFGLVLITSGILVESRK